MSGLNNVQKAINDISSLSVTANGATKMFSDVSVVQQYANALSGLNEKQVLLALSYKKLSAEQKEQILLQMGLKASEDTIQAELLQTTLAQKGVNAEKAKAILIDLGLMDAETLELFAQKACTQADLEAMLAQKGITGVQAEGIISALGLTTANTGLTASFGLLAKSIWSTIAALLSNPLTWVVAGVTATVVAINIFTTSLKEAKEQLEENRSEYENTENELKSVESELKSISERIAEIEAQDSLTITDKNELQMLRLQNEELEIQKRLLEENKRLRGLESEESAIQVLNTKTPSKYATETIYYGTGVEAEEAKYVTEMEELSLAMDEYNAKAKEHANIQKQINDIISKKKSLDPKDKEYKKLDKEQEKLEKQANEISNYMLEVERHANELAISINKSAESLNGFTPEGKAAAAAINHLNGAYAEFLDAKNGVASGQRVFNYIDNKGIEDQIKKLVNSGMSAEEIYSNIMDIYPELFMKMAEYGVTIDDIIEKYKELEEVTPQLSSVPVISIEQLFDIDDSNQYIQKQLDELSEGGNVNLKVRPVIDAETMRRNGWDEFEDEYATVYSSTFSNYNPDQNIVPEDEKIAINFTPIIIDPETGQYLGVMSPDEFNTYCTNVLNGVHDDYLNLQIGAVYTGEEAIAQAEKDAKYIHELHAAQVSFSDKFDLNEISEIKNDLIGMAQAGKLDADTLVAYEKYDKLLQHLGIAAGQSEEEIEAMVNAINGLATHNTVDYLNTYRDGLSKLVSAYTSFSKNERITSEQLSELQDAFGDLDSYQEFEKIITTGNGDIQEGFNAIATELAKDMDLFKGLTRETQKYWEADVTASGITNAHALAEAYLNQVEQERIKVIDDLIRCNADLDETKRDCIITSENLESTTADEIKMLILEAGYSYETAQALTMFAIKKQIAEKPLNTAQDVQELLELCSALGATTELMDALLSLKMAMGLKGSGADADEVNAALASAQQRVDAILNGQHEFDFSSIFNFENVEDDAKETADAWLEAYEKEYEQLGDLRDQGKISEKQYLEALKALYEKYFKGREKYAKEYAKAEREYLEGSLNLMESAINGIETLLQRKIDSIEKSRDAAIDSLEAERDAQIDALEAQKEAYEAQQEAIQEQIDALDKQIEVKQKEIDAIREANDERQREIDLQKAEYELNRLMNQRTNLVYTSGKGFVYRADETAIRDQKQEVEDAKTEIRISEIEKEISLIEERKSLLEEEQEVLDKKIEAIDKQIDSVNKHFDDLISNTEKMYEQMISAIEEQMAKWQELMAFKEVAEAHAAIEEAFGDLGYTVEDVLSGSGQAFEDFKQKYLDLLSNMNQNDAFQNGLKYAVGEIDATLGDTEQKVEEFKQALDKIGESAPDTAAIVTGLDSVGTSADTASVKTSNVVSNMKDLSGYTDGVAEDITAIGDAIEKLPDAEKVRILKDAFHLLATSLTQVSRYLGGDDTNQSIAGKISSLANMELKTDGGLIGYFNDLAEAINAVKAALTGGGTEIGGDQAAQAFDISGGEGGGGSLKDTLSNAVNGAKEQVVELAKAFHEDGNPVSVSGAIGEVVTKLGNPEGELSDESLTATMQRHIEYAVGEGGIPTETAEFGLMRDVIIEIQDALTKIHDTLTSLNEQEFTATFNIDGNWSGFGGFGFAGSQFMNLANGTDGLKHDEKNAIRSEFGQPELTVYPDGTTELTTEPTISDLPKGTVVYDEDDTKRFMNNHGKFGRAFAKGTGKFDFLSHAVNDPEKFKNFVSAQENGFTSLIENIGLHIQSIDTGMKEVIKHIANVSTMNKNSSNDMNVTIGDIHLHEVQNVEDLGRAIRQKLPGMVLQRTSK